MKIVLLFLSLGLPVSLVAEQATTLPATAMLIAHFDDLLREHIITIDDLERLQSSPELINPIGIETADSSSTAHVHHKQLEDVIAAKRAMFDMSLVQQWAEKKLTELGQQKAIKEEVREDTKELRREMHFVPIPAGKYTSMIDGSAFEVPEGIEIQDALVTQWQWVQVTGHNPVDIPDSIDTEQINVNGNKIKIQSNQPVAMVSMQEISAFLEQLNAQDTEYNYALPSVNEYLSILQSTLGNNWLPQLGHITSSNYLQIQHDRIWDLNNIWQFTRDLNETSIGKPAHLVFGAKAQTSTSSALLRPVLFDNSKGESIGLRLIRCKKTPSSLYTILDSFLKLMRHKSQDAFDATTYGVNWDHAVNDTVWKIEQSILMHQDDIFRFMLENTNLYSSEIQHTISVLKQRRWVKELKSAKVLSLDNSKIQNLSPLATLTQLQVLDLSHNKIQDLSHLAGLTQLQVLDLANNQILDISPLTRLTQLQELSLFKNQITNVEPLANVTQLKTLNLIENNIINKSSLDHLINTRIWW